MKEKTVRLRRPLETPVVAYTTAGVAVLVAVLAALAGLGAGNLPAGTGGVVSIVSGGIPLHSIEIQRDEDGRYLTADGMDVKQLAAKIKDLPPEVPTPVVLIRTSASTEIQTIAPVLKEMEAVGIKKMAILME